MTVSVRLLNNRRLASWLLWSSLAIHAPIAFVAPLHSERPGDFDNYYDIATRSGRPYVDFPVEFPIGAVQTFRTLGSLAGSRAQFGVSLVIFNVIADLAITAALVWGWGIPAAGGYAFVVIPLLDLFFLRMDLWSTAFATIGVAAWRREHRSAAAIAFVLGGGFKLWPLMFLPLLLVHSRSDRRLGPVATAVAAGCALLGVWLWVASWSGLYQVLTFRGATGWQVESTVGALWMLFDRSTARLEQGAWRIGSMSGPTSLVLFTLGAISCLWMIGRGARTNHLGAGWVGGLSSLLVMSALLSPQFAVWLAPATGVAWVDGDKKIAALTWLAVFFSNLAFRSFGLFLRGAPPALAIVLTRNALLALLAILAARLLLRASLATDSSVTPDGRQI